jgi:CHAD domain-containing protein
MKANRHREHEAKLEAPDDFRIPSLATTVDESHRRLAATYWDTPDLALLRWGHTLRYRRASDRSESGWTLKLGSPQVAAVDPSGAIDRVEVTSSGKPESPPDGLVFLVRGIIRGRELVPVAALRTDRRTHLLSVKGGGDIELSEDLVVATVHGDHAVTFRQIEVEAKTERSRKAIGPLVDRLKEAGATPTRSSKLEVALDRVPGLDVTAPSLSKDASVEDLVRSAVAAGTIRLIEHDPLVRLGSDPEAVHQARVATRRLRSDLKTLEPALQRSEVERIRQELGWIGGLLGDVRDLDVLINRVRNRARELPKEDRGPSSEILAGLDEDRGDRRRALVGALGSDRYLRILETLVEASNDPPVVWTDRSAREFLRKRIHKAWRRTLDAADRLDERSTDPELHEVRKRAKRARYAAELGTPLFPKRAARLAKKLEAVQEALGEIQDTVVAEDRFRSSPPANARIDVAFVAGSLAFAERETRRRERDAWLDAWRSTSWKPQRRWLAT